MRALEEVGARASTWATLSALEASLSEPGAPQLSHDEASSRLAQRWGLTFGRLAGYTGCWCFRAGLPPSKVMATGVGIRRWITQHGLALNCNCDLEWATGTIVPCGIRDLPVSSLSAITFATSGVATEITVASVRPWLLRAFEEVFLCEFAEPG